MSAQFGESDDVTIFVYVVSSATGGGYTGIAQTDITVAIASPDTTVFVPTLATSLELKEVNQSVVPGVYSTTIPELDFNTPGAGVYTYVVNITSNPNAIAPGGDSFTILSGVDTTTPAAAQRYGTAVRVNELVTTTKTTTQIETILDETTEFIERVVNDVFRSMPMTLEINGTGNLNLYLTKNGFLGTDLKALTVTSITRRDRFTDAFSVGTVVDTEIYQPLEHLVRIRSLASDAGWIWGHRNYQVVGTFGWASTPRPIHEASSLLAAERIQPGRLQELGAKKREDWADYEYESAQGEVNVNFATLTGYGIVDRILSRYLGGPIRISSMGSIQP